MTEEKGKDDKAKHAKLLRDFCEALRSRGWEVKYHFVLFKRANTEITLTHPDGDVWAFEVTPEDPPPFGTYVLACILDDMADFATTIDEVEIMRFAAQLIADYPHDKFVRKIEDVIISEF